MDFHSTGSGFLAAIQGHLAASRQTGRTKRLIAYLTDDDRVVCTDKLIASNLADRCAYLGKYPDIIVIPVKDWDKLPFLPRVKGRTILDHTWVEEFHLESLRKSVRELDAIEKRLSAVPKTEGKKVSVEDFVSMCGAGLEITPDGIRFKATRPRSEAPPSVTSFAFTSGSCSGHNTYFKLDPSFVKDAIAKGWAAGFSKPTASEPKPAIKIGQVWRNRKGEEVLITKTCNFHNYPEFKWGSASGYYTDKGIVLADGKESPFDLITLLEDVKPAIAVGQLWLCRDGVAVTVNSCDNHRVYPWNSDRDCYTDSGCVDFYAESSPGDLVTLVSSTAKMTRLAPGKAKVTALAWKVKDDDGTVSEGRTHVAGDADKALKRWVDQFMPCCYELLSVRETTNETP